MSAEHGANPTHTYEAFATSDFYVKVDSDTINDAPQASNIVDLASGTGAIITRLIEQGKARYPFTILAVDLDFDGLLTIREKFKDHNVVPVHASAEQVPVANNWAELVTACNSIHLMNPQNVFAEAYRILKPGGTIVINTAYEKTKGYGDEASLMFLGRTIAAARIALRKKGFTDIPNPVDLSKYAEDEYAKMAEQAGFVSVRQRTHYAEMFAPDVKAIFSYKDFLQGSLPGVPFETAREALVATVDPQFEKLRARGIEKVKRNWMIMIAIKPQ